MAKIPAVRAAVFGAKTGLTMAGLAQRATYETRGIDYKSRAPFVTKLGSSNITKKVKL